MRQHMLALLQVLNFELVLVEVLLSLCEFVDVVLSLLLQKSNLLHFLPQLLFYLLLVLFGGITFLNHIVLLLGDFIFLLVLDVLLDF